MAIERLPIISIEVPIPKAHFSLEGIDGVGKTTQFIKLGKELLSRGLPIQMGKSPSSTPLGEFLRHNMRDLETWERNALFLMDMIAILRDNDSTGKVLILDRYKDSNRVANRDMTLEEAEESVACLPETTRTFLLDLDPRIIARNRQDSLHSHSIDLDWQREKRRRYLELAERHYPRIVVIDAALKEEYITEFIAQRIIADLKERGLV